MCKAFSVVVTRQGKVFWEAGIDSHDVLIDKYNEGRLYIRNNNLDQLPQQSQDITYRRHKYTENTLGIGLHNATIKLAEYIGRDKCTVK